MKNLLPIALLASIYLTACSVKEDAPAPTQTPAPATAAAAEAAPNTGKIVQLMQAGAYTYAEVEIQGNQRVWMAGAPLQLKPSDHVQWGDYAVMQNFSSKALGRTFEQILFVNAWGPVGGAASKVAPHGTAPDALAATPTRAPPAQQGAAPADAHSGQVKSVSASGGYTYLEIDQNGVVVWVAVPGAVVKVGQTVAWDGGAVMQNFTAKSLNRTFDRIIFAGKVVVVS
ncbi:hypothetical protein [Rhodoferax sp.]|uniref:hypothetical protein n=1 Tax=Rhodoferax sp. TaxID=50421 RepID=UPI00274A15A5|nr:hypothetical protein [Rhodoferax sp.]